MVTEAWLSTGSVPAHTPLPAGSQDSLFPEHTQVHRPAVTTALPPSQTRCSKEAAQALGSEAIPKSLTQQSEHLVDAFFFSLLEPWHKPAREDPRGKGADSLL